MSEAILALTSLSRLAAGAPDPADFVQKAGAILLEEMQLDQVRLTIRTDDVGEVLSFDQRRSEKEPTLSGGYFLVAEYIEVRGIRYGRLELHVSGGKVPKADLLRAAEAASEQIARFFELAGVRKQNKVLRSEASAMRYYLETTKLVSRAVGIVAARQAIPPMAAFGWLRAEAGRLGRELGQVASRVVREEAYGSGARPAPLPPLARQQRSA